MVCHCDVAVTITVGIGCGIYFGGMIITYFIYSIDDPYIDSRYILDEMCSLVLWPLSLPLFIFRRVRRRLTKGYWKETGWQ